MSAIFDIKEHVVEAQHIREYARATAHSQEEVLHLSVKQYIPKDNPNPKPGDITIIASHANGFVKELYEPLWEDLLTECRKKGVNVRGIWIADIASQGQSGVLNENKLGNDPSWIDHARDLLHMTNVFRSSMPRPLVGVGHSFGGVILANVALMHPRLFSTMVFIDPVMSKTISIGPLYGFDTMRASSSRRDLWPSREEAVASIRRNKFYGTWDPRAVDALVKYGFRDTPTKLYPDEKDKGKATLTTTKHHEVFTYYRPTRQGKIMPHPIDHTAKGTKRAMVRSKIPDATEDVDKYPDFPFYQPVGPMTVDRLPNLRPGALWVFGADSVVCPPEAREEKLKLTGVGYGGSGGVKAGRVRAVSIEKYGHLVAVEAPGTIARHAAEWIAPEIGLWRKEEREFQKWAKETDEREKTVLGKDFLELISSVQGFVKPKI